MRRLGPRLIEISQAKGTDAGGFEAVGGGVGAVAQEDAVPSEGDGDIAVAMA